MTNFKTLAFAVAVFAGSASLAHAVTVVTLNEGTGWHYGESHAPTNGKMFNYDGGGVQFNLKVNVTSPGADFSFVDAYLTGDKYKITISGVGTSATQFLDNTNYDSFNGLNSGPYGGTFGPAWLNSAYGHYQITLLTGVYTVTVNDLNKNLNSYPAGWGVRLDAVPEPASWAMMLVGVGGLGGMLRSRRKAVAA